MNVIINRHIDKETCEDSSNSILYVCIQYVCLVWTSSWRRLLRYKKSLIWLLGLVDAIKFSFGHPVSHNLFESIGKCANQTKCCYTPGGSAMTSFTSRRIVQTSRQGNFGSSSSQQHNFSDGHACLLQEIKAERSNEHDAMSLNSSVILHSLDKI